MPADKSLTKRVQMRMSEKIGGEEEEEEEEKEERERERETYKVKMPFYKFALNNSFPKVLLIAMNFRTS